MVIFLKVLKFRLLKERNEPVTICNRMKLLADDGKMLIGISAKCKIVIDFEF